MTKRFTRLNRWGFTQWADSVGELHKDRGPALISPSGTRIWYHHGKVHKNKGSAIERDNGTKEWWNHGKCFRVERAGGKMIDVVENYP